MQGPDQKTIVLRGKIIDAEKALREGTGDEAAVVPSSWELVRRTSTGAETIVARGVAAFDLDDQGTLIYTNGRAIYAFDGGTSRLIIKERGIVDSVVFID